jgi:hypothetical protein
LENDARWAIMRENQYIKSELKKCMSCGEEKEEGLHDYDSRHAEHGPEDEGVLHGGSGRYLAIKSTCDCGANIVDIIALIQKSGPTPVTKKPSSILFPFDIGVVICVFGLGGICFDLILKIPKKWVSLPIQRPK